MQGKNSGLTLIELMISMAILAVIGIAIGSFIYTSMRQYQAASSEVEVQTEAQMVQNQLQNLLIDVSRGIYQRTDGLEIYNELKDTGKKEKILISYAEDESKLLYSRYYLNERSVIEGGATWEIDEDAKDEYFANYVTEFVLELYDEEGNILAAADKGKKIGWIEISISYQVGTREYETDFVITPRNPVIFSDDVNELYD